MNVQKEIRAAQTYGMGAMQAAMTLLADPQAPQRRVVLHVCASMRLAGGDLVAFERSPEFSRALLIAHEGLINEHGEEKLMRARIRVAVEDFLRAHAAEERKEITS